MLRRLAAIPALLPPIGMIVRGEMRPRRKPSAQKTSGIHRVEPVNLSALVLQKRLRDCYRTGVDDYLATDPEAGRIAQRIIETVDLADEMVNGSADGSSRLTVEWAKIRLNMLSPMTPAQAVVYFQEELGIELSEKQIRNWRDRGRLYAADRSKVPHRYRVLDIYAAWRNRYQHGWKAKKPSQKARDTAGGEIE
ncbi:hypothetical protein M3B43_11895 [Nesterenkonia massiliensis]|uniref:Uncharacterized protein n=1 Tax=Nesterenkonia massiliensis TaxID=1232429 RepID=A0ABT2HTH8_9MICC|nr:hypothetical protein [Nesterenkonia massiliensis]MCT1608003.1 hypothetical protein [Nesterenkonia massiliensis]